MTQEPVDTATVIGAQRGEPAARERLLVEAYERIFRYHLRLTRGARDEAQDLTQETMVRVMRALGGLREPDRFMPWALRIAANVWRDTLRRRPERPLAVEGRHVDAAEPGDSSSRVLGAFRSLPSPYREAPFAPLLRRAGL